MHAEPEEIDAIKEAELFLTFGRDVQAEEVLKEALKANPSNIPVQLKLLGIYANRKDINAFTTIARKLKDTGNESAWAEAAALGRAIDASNPMYEGAGGEPAVAAAKAISEPPKPGAMPALDMDIGFNIPMDLDVTGAAHVAEAAAPAMDFDVSGVSVSPMDLDVTGSRPAEPEVLLPDFDVTGGRPAAVAGQMDFDVTGSHPNVTESLHMDFDVTGAHPIAEPAMDFDVTGSHPNLAESLHMDFDVTGSHPSVTAAAAVPEGNMSTVILSSPMDFDISAQTPEAAPAAEAAPPSFGGMDFDISALTPEGAPAPAAASAAAAAPSSFGGLDFDISGASVAASHAAAEPVAPSMSGMDFDLGPSSPPAAEEAALESGAMDFDISAPTLVQVAKAPPALDLGLSGISLDLGEADTVVFPAAEAKKDERWEDVTNKLELARAFHEMGNIDNARELLGEVLNEGDEQQIEAARTLLNQL